MSGETQMILNISFNTKCEKYLVNWWSKIAQIEQTCLHSVKSEELGRIHLGPT